MMRSALIALLMLPATAILTSTSAQAGCDESSSAGVAVVAGTLVAGAESSATGCGTANPGDPPVITDINHVTTAGLSEDCVLTSMALGINPFTFCQPGADEDVDITPGMAAALFRTIPIEPSQLHIQPPNGRTLVNFETNFFTTTGEFDVTVPLLGQRIDLHITPSSFTWHYGDGASNTTAEPGSPYPALDVTHTYLKKGQIAPSVDTTYIADYRVNGGPWSRVDGTVTIPGLPVDLEVLTATPTLVGYDRIGRPRG